MTAPAATAAAFAAAYGREPESVWRAPGRVNLIGEHTDYNDGFVLPLAITYGVTAAAAGRDDRVLRLVSAQADQTTEVDVDSLAPGSVHGWAAYVAGVVWALRQRGYDVGGADVHVDGDVPRGAGLSSSAALECSAAAALCDVYGLELTAPELVQVTKQSENRYVGVPNGIMDQSASMLATARHALFLDARTLESRQVPLALADAGLALLVIDSKTPHALVDGEYAARRRSCEAAATLLGVRALRDVTVDGLADAQTRLEAAAPASDADILVRRMRHIVTENDRVLRTVAMLEDGALASRDGIRSVGALLTASHTSMRDDFEITAAQVDLAVETALAAGAHGARMTGGGFGGCVIALVDASGTAAVADAVAAAFATAGYASPVPFVTEAEAGAHRAG